MADTSWSVSSPSHLTALSLSQLGKKVEMVLMVYDCEGLGLKHLWKPVVEAYGKLLAMFEEIYHYLLSLPFTVFRMHFKTVLRVIS